MRRYFLVIFYILFSFSSMAQMPMGMEDVEPEVAEKTSLREIEFSLQRGSVNLSKWDRIPSIVLEAKEVKRLNIYESYEITSIPKELKNLSELQYLYLTGVGLDEFPRIITKLSKLEELHLGSSYYTSIDKSIGKLSNLKKLKLRVLPLDKLPESISKLKKLEELEITTMIGNYGIGERVIKLTGLNQLPNSIGDLKSLKKLVLSRNSLTELPPSIGELDSLKTLVVNFNPLVSLPDSFGNLKSIEFINFENTELQTLPKSFKNLKGLKTLILRNTKVSRSELEELKRQLPNCSIIDASGNRVNI